jgi:hypothetical protein
MPAHAACLAPIDGVQIVAGLRCAQPHGNGVRCGRRGTRTASGARQHQQPRQQHQARHLTAVRRNCLLPVPGKRRRRRSPPGRCETPYQICASPRMLPRSPLGTTACPGPILPSWSGPRAHPVRGLRRGAPARRRPRAIAPGHGKTPPAEKDRGRLLVSREQCSAQVAGWSAGGGRARPAACPRPRLCAAAAPAGWPPACAE